MALKKETTGLGNPTEVAARISVLSKLFLCSATGVLFFLTPIHYDGKWTILMGICSDLASDWIGDSMHLMTLPIFIVSSLISLLYYLLPDRQSRNLPYSERFTATHWSWIALSTIGGVVSTMLLLGTGPEWALHESTGVTAFIDVAGAIFLIIGLGCLLLPFLTDYGLLEFVGTLMRPVFIRLFRLPGRATVDTLASWVGASSIAVIMTSYQYERGYYSARESAVIATNFSVVSLPFVLLTSQVAGLENHFFQLYGTMVVVCVVCAIVVPKLPPLNGIPDEYYSETGKSIDEEIDSDRSRLSSACTKAYEAAAVSAHPLLALRKGLVSMIDIFVMMMPAAMTIEFLTLALYSYTPVFQFVTFPVIYLLEFMSIPEAQAAAPGVLVGLLDQFVPAIIAGQTESSITRFVLAGLSVTQLIFFAETALLIMRSKIPISVASLVKIFFIRTAIALPILSAVAHYIF